MTRSSESVRDQLLAETELAKERISRFRTRVAATSGDLRTQLNDRVDRVAGRTDELSSQIKDWVEVKVGSAAAVEDLNDAVDTLEADLDAAEEADAASYRSLVDRQIRTWRGRAERLRLQESLGVMEFRDDLEKVTHRLADARGAALVGLRTAIGDAKETVVDLRGDVEKVLVDARHVVERAADALVRDSSDN